MNPLNKTFITAGNDRNIHIWSLANCEQLARLEGHHDAVSCLALDGNFLLSGSEDGAIHIWDLHSFMALGVIKAHEEAVTGMLIEPESGCLVSCSTDRTVRVWDYGTAQELQVMRRAGGGIALLSTRLHPPRRITPHHTTPHHAMAPTLHHTTPRRATPHHTTTAPPLAPLRTAPPCPTPSPK